jgi:hypothetical protein
MLYNFYSNLSQFEFNSNSVQKYLKPLIFEFKILFKIQKKERVYVAASLAFGPFHRSAHFRLSFTPTETGPLRSAFRPDMAHQGVISHLRLSSAPPPLRLSRRAVRHLLPLSSVCE